MTQAAVSFQPVRFSDLIGWETDDHAKALEAFLRSCEHFAETALLDVELCREARAVFGGSATEARQFFECRFAPHRVVHDRPAGLLTGYYEPVVTGSRTRTASYQTPIYARPPDLINLVNDALRGAVGTRLTHARRTEDGVAPYATRAEIESGVLAGRGLELLYLADPVEAFVMHVQGSGVVELPDGSSVRLTYDGKNGHPYTSIGRLLVEAGLFSADELTMDVLTGWLRADPERGREIMRKNASYVFFRELTAAEAQCARGAKGIPLMSGRSLAVDADVHALGTPIYVVSPTLTHTAEGGPFQRLMIAQDVGSAITGPERGDVFFGSGGEAGRRAGMTRHSGNFFTLLPRARRKASPTP